MRRLAAFCFYLFFICLAAAGEDVSKTLSVLRSELMEYSGKSFSGVNASDRDAQREQMVELGRKCNDLSLVLYSQSQDYIFDLTYALGEVTRQYEAFSKTKMPYDEMVSNIDYEVDKYNRLKATIRSIRPTDAQTAEDRDSCLVYVERILISLSGEKAAVLAEAAEFEAMSQRLADSYEYAQKGYELIQRRIFKEGEDSYFKVIAHFFEYVRKVWNDFSYKYLKSSGTLFVKHDFLSLSFKLVIVFVWLLASLLLSLAVRVGRSNVRRSMNIYIPLLVQGLVVILFRLLFIPNSLLNLVYPPMLIAFSVWEFRLCSHLSGQVSRNEMMYGWVSFGIMMISSVIAVFGFVLMSIQIMVWWLFQIAAISTLDAAAEMLDQYEKKVLRKRIDNSEAFSTGHHSSAEKGDYIHVTWAYDLVKKAVLPVLSVLSLLLSVLWASDVFDLVEVAKAIFYKPFFNVSDTSGNVIHLSVFLIMLEICLFFIFRYVSYAGKAFYRSIKLTRIKDKSGKQFIHANEVNLTLANNVISICIWGVYIILSVNMLNIPMGAVSIIAAGLATGIGLAMKDILNNFIYGIQLMTGRLRVGDYVECDGVRGKVESISYQSTQIQTGEGAIMAFTNTTLFNQNFKNLTKNSYYELLKVPVGVAYGTDIEMVRKLLCEAVAHLQEKNDYDRPVIREDYGVQVAVEGFGDSSVDLSVKLYVLVSERFTFAAKARELIYNTLNNNHVEIPFPQRDIHIIQ